MNIVLYNIPESVQDEARTRKQEDIDRVSSLLNKYLGVKASINNAIPIGKKKEEPRLLKITVGSLQEKTMILRNKLKLREQKNAEDIRKIFINMDLTPLEQKKNKQLRDKLKEMNKNGNLYVTKNGAIVQRKTHAISNSPCTDNYNTNSNYFNSVKLNVSSNGKQYDHISPTYSDNCNSLPAGTSPDSNDLTCSNSH